MPAKNSRKIYLENSYYHVYNRGVEKRTIFLDAQDTAVFLKYLKEYLQFKNEVDLRDSLSNPGIGYKEKDKILKLLRLNNFYNQITLLAFCLMPNHFHFFIKQQNSNSLDSFMNSLFTRYSMYFNRKYHRVGPLFQGVYKASLVTTEEYQVYLSKYIHKQALSLQGEALQEKYPCSYMEYIGQRKTDWVHPEEILGYFNQKQINGSYKEFIMEQDTLNLPAELLIET
jgi:putative transposase